MRRLAIVLVVLALLPVAGCGGDDDGGENGGSAATTEQPTTDTTEAEATATDEPDAGGAPPTKEELTSCLADADLELKPGSEPVTDEEGKSRTREALEIDGATYLGYVQWPTKHIADVYLAKDEAAAEKAEKEAGLFVKAFGFEPADYVRRAGSVVLTFDDPPPTAEEAGAVEGCATGG
jgi:hypothetical protein